MYLENIFWCICQIKTEKTKRKKFSFSPPPLFFPVETNECKNREKLMNENMENHKSFPKSQGSAFARYSGMDGKLFSLESLEVGWKRVDEFCSEKAPETVQVFFYFQFREKEEAKEEYQVIRLTASLGLLVWFWFLFFFFFPSTRFPYMQNKVVSKYCFQYFLFWKIKNMIFF